MSPHPGPSTSSPKRATKQRSMLVGLLLVALLGGGLALVLPGCHSKPTSSWPQREAVQTPERVTLFFSKYQGNRSILEDVVRQIPRTEQGQPLRFALTELLKGPTSAEKSKGFYSEIPQGTRLLGVKQEKQAVVINLSRQFTTGGGSNSMEQRFQEVKKTAYSVNGVGQIQLAVEGRPLDVLGGEGLEVQESLQREPQ